jgi:UTP-glucose-1-phosphate uridylyltransferase
MGPSYYLLIVSAAGLAGIFVLFLVLGRTLNSIVNHLTAIQYYLEQELEVKKEHEEIKQLLAAGEREMAEREEESQS